MKNSFYMLMALCALLICLGGCSGDDSKESNPINVDSAVEESSSSDEEVSSSSSDKASPSSLLFKDSSGSTEDSGSVKALSSSGKKKSSSSVASSSSGTKVSEPADVPAEAKSSESAKSSAMSSSSSRIDSSQASSSSCSGVLESSSSSVIQESSSSSKTSEPVDESSSSKAELSSSAVQVIPSKLYDCSRYKCLPTQYLNPEIDYGELLDTRDNQVYRTVKIGDQVWMAQNLNYDIGDTAADSRFLRYYSSEVVDHVEDSLAKYGRAYTWVQAIDTTEVCYDSSCYLPISMLPRRGICPEGWHLPSERDWKLLEKYVDLNNDDEGIGVSLKVPDLWDTYPNAIVGTDLFGFSALPFEPKMSTSYPLQIIVFWTSDEYIDNKYYANVRTLGYTTPNFIKEYRRKRAGLAVRCLQD